MINQLKGHVVSMKVVDPLHYDGKVKKEFKEDDVSSSFGSALQKAFGKVNNLQVDAEKKMQQMIYDPGSIDIHTVMIAAQKAEIALSFTKSVRDEAIRAYRDLMNLR